MAFDRFSVTVPSELGAALRALAHARGETVSKILTDAIALQIRLAALDLALAEADKRHGPVSNELIEQAEVELTASRKRARRSRSSDR